MEKSTAQLNNFRQSPRKMRLVANLVRGKKVSDAIISLEFTPKRAAGPIKKLIESAIANAEAQGIDPENMVVKSISVDPGKIMYRRLPAARGTAHPMRKRTSKIKIEIGLADIKQKNKNK